MDSPGQNKKSNAPAYLALGAGIFSLSLSAMFVRWAGAPGPVTGLYRLGIAASITFPFFINRTRGRPIRRADLVFPLLGGIFTAGDFALWNTSVLFTTASNATLLGNTAPLWVAIGAWILFRERLTRDFWLGLALALSGAALILGGDFLLHPRFGLGDLMACGAGVFYAAYMLVTQRGRERMDAFSHWWIVSLTATFGLLGVNLALGNSLTNYPPQSWMMFAATALVSQIIGYLSISYALGHLPAAVVSPSMIGQPVVTAVLAIPLLGEIPGPTQLTGGLIALIGIFLVNQAHTRAQTQPRRNEELREAL
ncbi:MAG: DMT family transporter [Chloroflexota bacterium]